MQHQVFTSAITEQVDVYELLQLTGQLRAELMCDAHSALHSAAVVVVVVVVVDAGRVDIGDGRHRLRRHRLLGRRKRHLSLNSELRLGSFGGRHVVESDDEATIGLHILLELGCLNIGHTDGNVLAGSVVTPFRSAGPPSHR